VPNRRFTGKSEPELVIGGGGVQPIREFTIAGDADQAPIGTDFHATAEMLGTEEEANAMLGAPARFTRGARDGQPGITAETRVEKVEILERHEDGTVRARLTFKGEAVFEA